MVFSSYTFLFLFFTALLAFYFLIPARYREARNLLLLLFSLLFYGCGGPKYLLLMLVSIGINYFGGLLVAPGKPHCKLWKVLTVAANLGLLGWFKYANFFCRTLSSFGIRIVLPEIVLPIGISFFTFQGMSYVLDVSKGDALPEKNPLRIALYISLFPQLVAGPIVRYTTISQEISDRKETLDTFVEGAVRFIFGLAKKLIIANGVGQVADAVYAASPDSLTVSLAWLGSFCYTLQIYFDFSAYSDMAIGLGRMFGFHFLENFNYPYISRSVTEFWRRWHISLSSWFRDYIYIPLGGNRCGKRRQMLHLLIVWALTGLWHGAAWNFVLWGLYYAILLICERFVWGKLMEKAGFFRHVYALFFVNLGWVLFRAESLQQVKHMTFAMFGRAPLTDGQTVYYLLEYASVLVLAVIACLPWKNWLRSFLEQRSDRPFCRLLLLWWPRCAALALLAICYIKLLSSSFNPFIYFRF